MAGIESSWRVVVVLEWNACAVIFFARIVIVVGLYLLY